MYLTKIIPALLIMFISLTTTVSSQDYSLYQKELYISKSDTLPYRILFPKNFDRSKEYPLILFLHGSGERGHDNELQLVHGSYLFLKDSVREKFPAIVVFPQCQTDQSWNNSRYRAKKESYKYKYPTSIKPNLQLSLVEGLLAQLKLELPIDKKKIYLGGLSMGGMGTFELLHRNPNTFAAAFAICGGANPRIARKIKNTPIWIFHGEADDVVPARYSSDMFEALIRKKAEVKFTLYPMVAHDSWTNAFAEPELLPWLFSKEL